MLLAVALVAMLVLTPAVVLAFVGRLEVCTTCYKLQRISWC